MTSLSDDSIDMLTVLWILWGRCLKVVDVITEKGIPLLTVYFV